MVLVTGPSGESCSLVNVTATVRPLSCLARPRTRAELFSGPGPSAGRKGSDPSRGAAPGRWDPAAPNAAAPPPTHCGQEALLCACSAAAQHRHRHLAARFASLPECAAPPRSRCPPGPARIPSVRRGPPRETAPLAASHGRGQGGDRRRHHGGGRADPTSVHGAELPAGPAAEGAPHPRREEPARPQVMALSSPRSASRAVREERDSPRARAGPSWAGAPLSLD